MGGNPEIVNMARPLKNRSNFWDDRCLGILKAAAAVIMRKANYKACVRNRLVEADDLVSWGWFYVVRYGGRIDRMYLRCKREMWNYLKWIEQHTMSKE